MQVFQHRPFALSTSIPETPVPAMARSDVDNQALCIPENADYTHPRNTIQYTQTWLSLALGCAVNTRAVLVNTPNGGFQYDPHHIYDITCDAQDRLDSGTIQLYDSRPPNMTHGLENHEMLLEELSFVAGLQLYAKPAVDLTLHLPDIDRVAWPQIHYRRYVKRHDDHI